MPYIANPDDTMVAQIGKALLAIACRPTRDPRGRITEYRIPRAALYALIAPTMIDLRREDFNAAVRRMAEETNAIREITGTGKRADVVLNRVTDDIGEWEYLLYDDFEDDFEVDAVHELLAGRGYDVSTEIPHHLLILRKQRPPVVHDQEAPRKCARCQEVKALTEFRRRSTDPSRDDYRRWQSYCRACGNAAAAAKGRCDARVRTERYGGRSGRIRPGARHERGWR